MEYNYDHLPVFNKDATCRIVKFYQMLSGMQPHQIPVGLIGSIDPRLDWEWPEKRMGLCKLIPEKYFMILVKNMPLEEFSNILVHELFHAHETVYTTVRYKCVEQHGYEEYYNCESEIMARTHSKVYGKEMFRYLKSLLDEQRKQGIRRSYY